MSANSGHIATGDRRQAGEAAVGDGDDDDDLEKTKEQIDAQNVKGRKGGRGGPRGGGCGCSMNGAGGTQGFLG